MSHTCTCCLNIFVGMCVWSEALCGMFFRQAEDFFLKYCPIYSAIWSASLWVSTEPNHYDPNLLVIQFKIALHLSFLIEMFKWISEFSWTLFLAFGLFSFWVLYKLRSEFTSHVCCCSFVSNYSRTNTISPRRWTHPVSVISTTSRTTQVNKEKYQSITGTHEGESVWKITGTLHDPQVQLCKSSNVLTKIPFTWAVSGQVGQDMLQL